MTLRCIPFLVVAAVLLPEASPAQVADMSGTWILNKQRSRWGPSVRPFSVTMRIEHREPGLKYDGTITYADEETREFAYEGAIDGQPRAVERPAGSGTMTHLRVGPREFRTEFRVAGGHHVQIVDTEISRDGKTLIRKLRIETPAGVRRWTEIYDRK